MDDSITGFEQDETVVHKVYGEGRIICTLPGGKGYGSVTDRAVVHFSEDGTERNVFLSELKKG
ncbi:hypothetical protein [Paenibacillus illinoisensis]|uniref:hypothetical protein n=1 Tax=Paenibacillus illinoisensis TaxID=59845 RepID=UPI00301BB163